MRERRPGDWRIDLARRHPLEDLVEESIDQHPALQRLSSSTNSLDRLDFQVLAPGERLCEIELKAKHQPYHAWGHLRPDTAERDLFILDELALRKLVDAGRYAFLLVHDQPQQRWLVWSTMELVLASKVRVNRRLATGVDRLKAKILLDVNETPYHESDPMAALSTVASYVRVIDRHWTSIGAWPTNRSIPVAGAAAS
jgi:hypothetical protein